MIRPIANLYRITPLAAGETPAGPPIAFVRQKKLAVKEHIRFFADESETQELFSIRARTWLDTGGSRYDVEDAHEGRIGVLEHVFGKSLLRSTWRVSAARIISGRRFFAVRPGMTSAATTPPWPPARSGISGCRAR